MPGIAGYVLTTVEETTPAGTRRVTVSGGKAVKAEYLNADGTISKTEDGDKLIRSGAHHRAGLEGRSDHSENDPVRSIPTDKQSKQTRGSAALATGERCCLVEGVGSWS
ncbi:MAG: hypothetical protein K2W95_31480 [Candidatus Obscuribacterales bacterium]|nr:hypothetical protein [Candidatus Obscuribacterales bacterium]